MPFTDTGVLKIWRGGGVRRQNTSAGWSIGAARRRRGRWWPGNTRPSRRRNAVARKQFGVRLCTINTNCIWFQSVNARQLNLRTGSGRGGWS